MAYLLADDDVQIMKSYFMFFVNVRM